MHYVKQVEIIKDTCKVQKTVAAVKISVEPLSYEVFFLTVIPYSQFKNVNVNAKKILVG